MNTYLPLLAVQRRDHRIGYDMPVREYESAAAASAASAEARARLRQPALLPPPPVTPPKPYVAAPGSDVPQLNMLAPCSWRFLARVASLRSGIDIEDIMSRSRKMPIVAARIDAISMIYQHTQYSMPGLAKVFGVDHTTILYALEKTGSVNKLVEVLPHMDAARRSKRPEAIVIADVKPTAIPVPTSKPANAVQRVVRAGYRAGTPRDEIAGAAGIEPGSVRVIANRMGLRRSDFVRQPTEVAPL